MKQPKILLPLFVWVALSFVLTSCSQEIPSTAETAEPQLQQNNAGAIFCKECADGCILGYEFTTANLDGNHPQGGYKLGVIRGQCECKNENGKFFAYTQGNYTSDWGQIGGPGSGSLPSPVANAWLLFNFSCGGGGGIIGGIGNVHEEWSDFVHTVQNNNIGPLEPGLVGWPQSWNVNVRIPGFTSNVLVELPNEEQSSLLDQIAIIDLEEGDPIATFNASGQSQYSIDLSDLPAGDFSVALRFAPGFTLHTPFIHYIAGE